MKFRKYFSLAILLLCSFYAQAQVGLYADLSAGKVNVPRASWIYGPTFGAYFDRGRILFLSPGLDARGAFLGSGNNKLYSGLVGPRLSFQPHPIPIKPYVEALIGVGHAGYYQGSAPTTVTKFEYQFLGGIDLTVLPRLDWRIVEFSYGGLAGLASSFNPKTLSTGIVVRLP